MGNGNNGFMTTAEIDKVCQEALDMPNHIRFDGGCFLIDYGGYEYWLEKYRVRNQAALLHWVLHLSEKSWMNPARIRYFAELVAHTNNFQLETF